MDLMLSFGNKKPINNEEFILEQQDKKESCEGNIHFKSIDLYCINIGCNTTVCAKCIKSHSQHAMKVIDIDDLYDECQNSSLKITKSLIEFVKVKDLEKDRIQENFATEVESKYKSEVDRVSSQFRHYHDALHQKEIDLKARLTKVHEDNIATQNTLQTQIETDVALSNELIVELGKPIQTTSNPTMNSSSGLINLKDSKCKIIHNHVKSNQLFQNYKNDPEKKAKSKRMKCKDQEIENIFKDYGFHEPSVTPDDVLNALEIKNSEKSFKSVFIYGNAAFQKLNLITKKLDTIAMKGEKFPTSHGIFKSMVATHDHIFIFKRSQYLQYDPKSEEWVSGLFADSYNGGDWQSAEYDGRDYIYLFGGCIDSTNHRDINRFNIRTKKLEVEFSQTRIPIRFQTTCIADGKFIYTICGVKQTNTDKESILERFDIQNKTLSRVRDFEKDGLNDVTSMCYVKSSHSIYIINREHNFFKYNIKEDILTKLSQTNEGLQQFYTRLYYDHSDTIYCVSRDSASEYSITNNTWSKLAVPKFHAFELYVFGICFSNGF